MSDGEIYKTIELRKKIRLNDREWGSIDLRPPTIGERRQAEGKLRRGATPEAATEYALQLLSSNSGIPQAAIEQMEGDQFEEAFLFVQNFFNRGRETGSS